jgi:hypothetical protein
VGEEKMSRIKALLLCIICAAIALSLFTYTLPTGHAAYIVTENKVFLANSYDGYITYSSSNYTLAHTATSGTVQTASVTDLVGQDNVYPTIYRSFLFFDTSSIPATANITSAKLCLYFYTYSTSKNVNVTIQTGGSSYPGMPLSSSDYNYLHYSGNGGSYNFTNAALLQYYNITMNTAGWTYITKAGVTKLVLRDARDINALTFSGPVVFFASSRYSPSQPAKLYVTYQASGYQYTIHGPYYESGAVFPGAVNVTLYQTSSSPLSYLLSGSGGSAQTQVITTEAAGSYFSWNISVRSQNRTRTYFLLPTQYTDELYVFVPNSGQPCNQYTIDIADLAGITSAYLSDTINVNGQTRTVERQSINVIYTVTFWMQWATRYSLVLTCNKGTFIFGDFQALSTTSQILTVLPSMFPISINNETMNVHASRLNSTCVEMNYTDTSGNTAWVNTVIYAHSLSGDTLAYQENDTGSVQQVVWNAADSTLDYYVVVSASYLKSVYSWTFPASAAATSNVFGTLWDTLGIWPFSSYNFLGFIVILFVFGWTTYLNKYAGYFLTVALAAIFVHFGLMTIGWDAILLSGMLVFLIYFADRKREQRDV